jgi:hypothetical protein
MRKLKGVILPSTCSGDRIIDRISLFTLEDEEYLLELDEKEWELRRHLDQYVEILGRVMEEVLGINGISLTCLKVTSFSPAVLDLEVVSQ